MGTHHSTITRLAVCVAALSVVLAGCGSGGDQGMNSATSPQSAKARAAAKAALEPYLGQPSDLPVTEPLGVPVPSGASFGYIATATPTGALLSELTKPAAQVAGLELNTAAAGTTAAQTQSAASSLLAQKPSAIGFSGLSPALFSAQIADIEDADIPIIASAISKQDAENYGVAANISGGDFYLKVGEILAAMAATEVDEPDVVFYTLPDLAPVKIIQSGFEKAMGTFCSGCNVRYVDVALAAIGKTAPQQVVSDLQANPDTNVTVFGSFEIAIGLANALSQVNRSIPTLGFGGSADQLDSIKKGELTATLMLDRPVAQFLMIDAALRSITGQPIPAAEIDGTSVLQILRQEDITFDTSKTWTGYPNAADTFAKMWGTE